MDETLLNRREVQRRCGSIPTSTLYRWVRDGSFPAPLKIGPQAIRWRLSEVLAWIESRPRATGEATAQ